MISAADGVGGVYDSDGGGAPDLGVEREGLGEPEGVGVVFVVVAKLLTLTQRETQRERDSLKHKVEPKCKIWTEFLLLVLFCKRFATP